MKSGKFNLGDGFEGLFPHFDKEIINYFYSRFFNSENIPEIPNKVYSRLNYDVNLLAEARELLKSTRYDGLEIIVNELINPEVLQILGDKFNLGEKFSQLETIIADVAILTWGVTIESSYGMVNSESDFNENSFEKTIYREYPIYYYLKNSCKQF